jgi:hypothetical protein
MKFGGNLVNQVKSLAKRSRMLDGLYSNFIFFKTVPGKDLLSLVKDVRKLKLILAVRPYTLLPYPRLSALYELAYRLERDKKSGSFVECGVCNGGSAAAIAAVTKGNNRHVWLFDSWEGWPEPDEKDFTDMQHAKKGGCLGSEEKTRELLFKRLKLDSTRVHLVKGFFSDTLPRKEIGTIALLHLDCDLYESVRFCLESLYDDVIEGGCIVIDDYGCWKGCKDAVDEFIERRKLKVDLVKVDSEGVYFRKAS